MKLSHVKLAIKLSNKKTVRDVYTTIKNQGSHFAYEFYKSKYIIVSLLT